MEKPNFETMQATAQHIVSGIVEDENATFIVVHISPDKTGDTVISESMAVVGKNPGVNAAVMIFALQLAYVAAARSDAPAELTKILKGMAEMFSEATAEEDTAPVDRERGAYLH